MHYRKPLRQGKLSPAPGFFSLPGWRLCAKSAGPPATSPEQPMNFNAIKTAVLGPISSHIDLLKAAVLGVVEGLTEFLPVSSTGHLLLMEHFFGWGDDAFGKSFAILIQLGAILALLTIYFGRIWALATHMFTQWAAARFVIGVLLAFLPAAVIGALAHGFIKEQTVRRAHRLHDVHRRRLHPAAGRSDESEAALFRSHRILTADVFRHRRIAVPRHDPRRVALGRDHRRRDAVRRRPAFGGGILVLAGDADYGRRLRLRGVQEPRRSHACGNTPRSRSASSSRLSSAGSW